ncbi:MAG: phosphoglycerate mutase (2,3-diphosphoglycerate-independent), partial [Firmicutes bacterium]|nr:phosphoglycerate mutase (2,3-diphosphoglycerate-independent) [Bacillota bacterium]
SAPALLRSLDEKLDAIGRGVVVDGIGRGIALDRDGNYSRIQKAYEEMVLGKGARYKK